MPFDSLYRVDSNGCWIWISHKDYAGYGNFYDKDSKKVIKAQRYSYLKHKGEIPLGLEIDHICEVPSCVNPNHLQLLTHLENMRKRKCNKLNKLKVLKMLRMYKNGITQRELSNIFYINQSNVSRTLNQLRWKIT